MAHDPSCLVARTRTAVPLAFTAIVFLVAFPVDRAAASTPVEAGYRDFSYGTTVTPTPTGEKPESKLWWNDGSWWGILWSDGSGSYVIHRLDLSSQSWVATGTAVDSRPGSKCDVLWDGARLYVVSHIFSESPGPVSSESAGRLYRYAYDPTLDSYSLDPGFPVLVNGSKSETLVLERDSTGKLWVTWIEDGRVQVNASAGDDRTWGQPFDLPGQGNPASSDDISSVVAMDGGIGIMWSNQNDMKMYFSVHPDGNSDLDWEPREEALADSDLGAVADDHINLKRSCSGDGALYGVVKTSLSGSGPLVYLLKRSAPGTWSRHVVGLGSEGHTRPLVLLKQDENRVYVFATGRMEGPDDRQVIYMKSANLSDLEFPTGLGIAFIHSALDSLVNDPTGTKQCLNASTGIVVLASARDTRFYLHEAIAATASVEIETEPSEASGRRLSSRPNPMHGEARIQYSLTRSGPVRLAIHDVAGRLVSVLTEQVHVAGAHATTWNGRDSEGRTLPHGVYFCRMEGPEHTRTIKILLMR